MKHFILALSFFFCAPLFLKAQSTRYPNIDFELGNLSVWKYSVGRCCPISLTAVSGPIYNRHTLTTGTGLDPYGHFPVVSPLGGRYSMRLGNSSVGSEAEGARYVVHVPVGTVNYSLLYSYAIVLENPTDHDSTQQPRFEAKVIDSSTNMPLTCLNFSYVASSGLPGFIYDSTSGLSVIVYRPWTNGTMNLSGLSGKTLYIDFSTGDCALGAHFGYAYVDLKDTLFVIENRCVGVDSMLMIAPPGYSHYYWYDSAMSTIFADSISTSVRMASDSQTYNIVLVPYVGYGCLDTLRTTIKKGSSVFDLIHKNDTAICPGLVFSDTIQTISRDSNLRYSWSPASAVSCPTCKISNITATNGLTIVYSARDNFGCFEFDTFTISRPYLFVHMPDTSICLGDSLLFSAEAVGDTVGSTYLWEPVANFSCPTCKTTSVIGSPTVVTIKISNLSGCSTTDTFNLHFHDIPTLDVLPDITLCKNTPLQVVVRPDSFTSSNITWGPLYAVSCTHCNTATVFTDSSRLIYVTVYNSVGCSNSDTFSVNIAPDPKFEKLHDTLACVHSHLYYSIDTKDSNSSSFIYNWWGRNSLDCTTCGSTTINVIVPDTIIVKVTNKTGCSTLDTFEIVLDNCNLTFPNAFTPNDDGRNDFARAIGVNLNQLTYYYLSIYNRFGERVFHTEDYSEGWDGKHNNIPQDANVFFYELSYQFNDDTRRFLKGDITLVR